MINYKYHLEKYPNMQIEDKIKLFMQAILGPAHLVSDLNSVLNRMNNEYELIKDLNYEYDYMEEISDKYIRIYLKPYYEKNHDFSKLSKAFYLSTFDCNCKNDLYNELENLKQEENKDNQEFIDNYIQSGNVLISHSSIYRSIYFPHYCVINKKYIDEI